MRRGTLVVPTALAGLLTADLDEQALMAALLEALHALIPSDRNLFDWVDEAGELTHYVAEGPIDTDIARRYFEHFHDAPSVPGMPEFRSIAQTPMSVRGAAPLLQRVFLDSPLYHEVWRPQGMHSRIEGIVRAPDGALLGSLVLYRGPRDAPFSVADERRLGALLPPIGAALQRARQRTASSAAAPRRAASAGPPATIAQPGAAFGRVVDRATLLLDACGTPRQMTASATRLVLALEGGLTPQAVRDGIALRVRQRVAPRLVALQRVAAQRAGAGASALLRDDVSGAWSEHAPLGRFDLQLRPLVEVAAAGGATAAGTPAWTLDIARREPRPASVARTLREWGATAGQSAVGHALVDGASIADVARRLGVANSTVVDHLRKLYQRSGESSIDDLRRRLQQFD